MSSDILRCMERVTDFILLRTGESEIDQRLWILKISELDDLVSDRTIKHIMDKYEITESDLRDIKLVKAKLRDINISEIIK